MSKTVPQRRVTEMPYLTKAQVEYLHNAWNKSSGIGGLQEELTRVRAALETTQTQLDQCHTNYQLATSEIDRLQSANQTLTSVNSQQAATITQLNTQLAAANGNQMPNNADVVTGDQTIWDDNCIVFMSFTPNTSTFNVATIYQQSGSSYQIAYPGAYCPYICIFRSGAGGDLYNVFYATTTGGTTEQVPGNRLYINYSADNTKILLLNHTD